MRLHLTKRTGTAEATIETPHAEIDLREFLQTKIDPYKYKKSHEKGLTNYTDLLIEAEVDHAQYYTYISKRSGITMSMLRLLEALGYEIHIIKKRQS